MKMAHTPHPHFEYKTHCTPDLLHNRHRSLTPYCHQLQQIMENCIWLHVRTEMTVNSGIPLNRRSHFGRKPLANVKSPQCVHIDNVNKNTAKQSRTSTTFKFNRIMMKYKGVCC